jgi:chemotaxis protein MotA
MGAVLGLIHTMTLLNDPTKLGDGIAVAFVATLYGVGCANLLAYPIAKKIRSRAITEKEIDRIVIAAIKGIQDGQRGLPLRQALTGGSASQGSGPMRLAPKNAA